MFRLICLSLISCVATLLMAGYVMAQPQPESLGVENAQPLELENIGTYTARTWYRLQPAGRADDDSPWRRLIWFKKDQRTARRSFFASVDYERGTVTELPVMVPAMEPWAHAWLNGKLYIGMNLPPRLVRYDPATDELTDLGLAFEDSATLFRIAVSPDGILALGGGTGTDLATFNPETGEFRRYGSIGGPGSNYVYSLSIDEEFIYCAVRAAGPWELVVIHRETGERNVLATAPVDTHMSVSGNVASVPVAAGQPSKRYHLVDGGIRELAEGERPDPLDLPGGGFSGNPPQLFIDEAPLVEGEERLRLFIESPNGEINEAMLAVGLDTGDGLGHLVATEDGRIAAIGRAYYPMVITDLHNGESRRIPMTMTSSYCLATAGNRIFATGYPSTNLIACDPDKELTWPNDLPDRPGVDIRSEEANPRLVHYFSADTGGAHIGVSMTTRPVADGRIYLIARRHRYYFGFALAHFDPETLETGVFDDEGAFDHLQIGWMTPIDGGRRLAITTYVEHNQHLEGEPPATASLFIYDVENGRIESSHLPVPGATTLLAVEQVAPNRLVGFALEEGGVSALYRFNTETGRTEQIRRYSGVICGGTGTLGVPVRTIDFTLGPDEMIWTGTAHAGGTYLFRINPRDLSVEPFGTVSGSYIRLLFHEGRLFISGAPQVRMVGGYRYR